MAPKLWRRLGSVFVAGVAVAIAALIYSTASAPATLTGVFPADGTRLATAPAEVSVNYVGAFRPSEFHLTVASATGATVTCAEPSVNEHSVTVPVHITEAGLYRIAYHGILSDGRTTSGITAFTVESGQVTGCQTVAAPQGHVHGKDPLSVVLTCVALSSIAALAVIMLRRPRLRKSAHRES